MPTTEIAIKEDNLISRIFLIRGEKFMLDYDLAMLYGTESKKLKQAVKRNNKRFPNDFMFELTQQEFDSLRSQIVTSKREIYRDFSLPKIQNF